MTPKAMILSERYVTEAPLASTLITRYTVPRETSMLVLSQDAGKVTFKAPCLAEVIDTAAPHKRFGMQVVIHEFEANANEVKLHEPFFGLSDEKE